MTPILRAVDARFARAGVDVGPLDLRLGAGQTLELAEPTARAASIAARLCAAIVKPTSGTILIGEYETRLQPAQAKRSVGCVDAGGFTGGAHAFKCEVAFRSDVWGIGDAGAQSRSRDVLRALGEDPFTRAVALALVADVTLLVLDQPPRRFLRALRALADAPAIVLTRVALPNVPGRSPELATTAK